MAKFKIISADGKTLRYEGYPKYTGTYLGVPYLEFATIESPTPIDWQRGDYVDYSRTGLTYKLYFAPQPKKQANKGKYGASFVYSNVKFYSAVKDLEIAPFRDVVTEDNEIHFSTRPDVNTYENVYGIAKRIQENLNDLFPDMWQIEVYDTDDADLVALFSETKEFSVSNGTCLDALSQIYESWKNVGWVHKCVNGKNIITIGRNNLRDNSNTTSAYAYGKGKGLSSIKKVALNEEEFATRLYVYGSERNIQTRYYNGQNIHNKESVDIRNLMLPISVWGKTNNLPDARKAYIQADDALVQKYGLIPRTVYFDGNENEEIYPSITGLTYSQVRKEIIDSAASVGSYMPKDLNTRIDVVYEVNNPEDNGTKEKVEATPTFSLILESNIGFNIAEQGKLTAEGEATISMKTGMCAGREFKVKKHTAALGVSSLTLERYWDESLGMGFPNKVYPITKDDQFVLLDIPMPDFYITLAEKKLLEAGQKMLEDYTRVSASYEPSIDPIVAHDGSDNLREGMFMQVYDEDVIDTEDGSDFVLIDTLTIDEKGELPTYKVTLREQKRSAKSFGTLEDMIEDTKRETSEKINKQKEYTERRFRSAQETIDMLQGAFSNFSESISPVTIQTMSMLVGDESLQFRFVTSKTQPSVTSPSIHFDKNTKTLVSSGDIIQHMTIGVNAVSPSHLASDYKFWSVQADELTFEEADKPYYLYIKASKNSESASLLVSRTAISMEPENDSDNYYFLSAILNSELDGDRSLVFVNGFTEVLPGQITTSIIKDASGRLIIDLANATITANDGATLVGNADISGRIRSKDIEIGGKVKYNYTKIQDALGDGTVKSTYLIHQKGTPPTYISFSGAEHTGLGDVLLKFVHGLSAGTTIQIICEPRISKNDARLVLSNLDFYLTTEVESDADTPKTTNTITMNGGKIELYYTGTAWLVLTPITKNITYV